MDCEKYTKYVSLCMALKWPQNTVLRAYYYLENMSNKYPF